MPTLLDLLTEAATDIAELGQGESLSPEDAAYMMGKSNEMLDSLSTERLNIYFIEETELILTAKQIFQIGPGATDFNQPRPVKIEACVIRVPVNGVNLQTGECDIVGEGRWREITDLSATSNVPEILYPDYNSPVMNLNFFPAPLCVVTTIAQLSQWLPLQQFVALTDEFDMPYGYQAAFVKNLSVVIMMSYGHPIDPATATLAAEYKGRIQQLNAQLPNLGLSNGIPPRPAPAQ